MDISTGYLQTRSENPFSATPCISSSLNPNRLAASSYSPTNVQPNIAGIVRIQHDRDARVVQPPHGMILDALHDACHHVARDADLERDPAIAQMPQQHRIVDRRDPVADPLRPDLQRGPDRLPDSSPSPACAVSCKPCPFANAKTSSNHSAGPRSSLPPIPNATTPSILPRGGPFRHLHRLLDGRTGGRHPGSTATFTGDSAAASRTASKIGPNSCSFHSTTPAAKMISAYRTFCACQPLQQAPRDEGVVRRRPQALDHRPEGLQKTRRNRHSRTTSDLDGVAGSSSRSVAGSTEPSRCKCSSALGISQQEIVHTVVY